MSHDESLHTLYSWNLYAGKGYQHDPLMHGPSLFHITALMYFLFGDSDFSARMGPALFGIAMVILPYWFRPWLGRVGALAASFMILISPG
jgi:predicted membrane-bound mannosyltransferase